MSLNQLVKKDAFIFIFMIVIVPLAGELKFYPVNETFRISFGPPAFFFCLLLLRKSRPLLPGFLTGAAIVMFRVGLDVIQHKAGVSTSFYHHVPSFFFYFTYAFLFFIVRTERYKHRSFFIGLICLMIELIADFVELFAQFLMFDTTMTFSKLSDMILIAFAHSFVVISFFNMMRLYEAQSREKQMLKQNEHMMMVISNLYEETVHLKKTLKHTEHITQESYRLYRLLHEHEAGKKVSQELLKLAGEIHEVKKDNQRIYAGLSKLISKENMQDYMKAEELVHIVIRIQEKYAQSLGKNIIFQSEIRGIHLHDYHVFIFLSLINNLVANAVEAIEGQGTIMIVLKGIHDKIEVRIEDDGPGIPDKLKEVVFDPGYTSKFDAHGTPSTGIGLSYVRELVQTLGGQIQIESKETKGTAFQLVLPIQKLIQRG
ncbi:ATP-binding protein [Bacillus sp. 179-C3.3 HS]|uniref:ATP-binding protein n=1 Tax=Bacillus sp. 179-C3.3 HS TaxID=3232162 RepID=UPI0039A04515